MQMTKLIATNLNLLTQAQRVEALRPSKVNRFFGIFVALLIGKSLMLMPGLAFAQKTESVKIVTASDRMMIILKPILADIEKASGVKIEVSKYNSSLGAENLAHDRVDGIIAPDLGDVLKTLENEKKIPTQNSADYDRLKVSQIFGYFGVPASNKVPNLSTDQVSSVLKGKVTNWKEFGGADQPIALYLLSDLTLSNTKLISLYGDGPKSKFNSVKDMAGVGWVVKENPAAVFFVIERRPEIEGIAMKYFKSEISADSFLHFKKAARPAVHKVVAAFKARGMLD